MTDCSSEAEKLTIGISAFVANILEELSKIQRRLRGEAIAFQRQMTCNHIENYGAFKAFFENGQGFVVARWCGTPKSEQSLRDLGVTVRCLPYEQAVSKGLCVLTGNPASTLAVFARAY